MTAMKIALLMSSFGLGGTERQALHISEELARRGHEVLLWTLYAGGQLRTEAERLPLAEVRPLLDRTPSRPTVWLPFAIRRLRKFLRHAHPDVLYSLDYPSNLAAAIAGRSSRTAVVWGVRNLGRDLPWRLRLFQRAGGALRRRADFAICNSTAGQRNSAALGYLPSHSGVVPNGIDTTRFAPSPPARQRFREAHGLTEQDAVFGIVSRVTPEKDIPCFLAACARLAEADAPFRALCILPDHDESMRRLEGKVSDMGLAGRVTCHSVGSSPEEAYPALDVFVSSSASEGFSNSIAEAMSCGCPCVVTDVGASAEIVGDSGVVVPRADPVRLADGIASLLRLDRHQRASKGGEARARIETSFGLEVMGKRTEEALLQARSLRHDRPDLQQGLPDDGNRVPADSHSR